MGEVWVRNLTDGSMAVAMPNLGNGTATLTVRPPYTSNIYVMFAIVL